MKSKIILKTMLYFILLALFYFLYMKDALSQFKEGKTTMSEMRKKIELSDNREAPVLIICPEPGFKSSFFDENHIEFFKSLKKFFWNYPAVSGETMKKFEHNLMDAYMNMSYNMGKDFNLSLIDYE
jgi:hypothetical protein